MNIELILEDVIQNRSSIISHNIKAIAPRLNVVVGSTYIKATGWALQEEIDEIMETIHDHHPGNHSLRVSFN